MNPIDLEKTLRAWSCRCARVPAVLENIVKQSWNLSSVFWAMPHQSNFIIDRQTLFIVTSIKGTYRAGPRQIVARYQSSCSPGRAAIGLDSKKPR